MQASISVKDFEKLTTKIFPLEGKVEDFLNSLIQSGHAIRFDRRKAIEQSLEILSAVKEDINEAAGKVERGDYFEASQAMGRVIHQLRQLRDIVRQNKWITDHLPELKEITEMINIAMKLQSGINLTMSRQRGIIQKYLILHFLLGHGNCHIPIIFSVHREGASE